MYVWVVKIYLMQGKMLQIDVVIPSILASFGKIIVNLGANEPISMIILSKYAAFYVGLGKEGTYMGEY